MARRVSLGAVFACLVLSVALGAARPSLSEGSVATADGQTAYSHSLPVLPISRLPNTSEKRAIRRAAMRDCRSQEVPGYKCRWRGHVVVSTINPRYAWAEVAGPNYDNSGVLRRGVRHPAQWKMIRVVGGGIQSCGYWRRVVPPRVVTEFHIEGFTEGDEDFTYHPC